MFICVAKPTRWNSTCVRPSAIFINDECVVAVLAQPVHDAAVGDPRHHVGHRPRHLRHLHGRRLLPAQTHRRRRPLDRHRTLRRRSVAEQQSTDG